jgi:hypothetical protein
MANGRMSSDQLATARKILVEVRQRIADAAGTDQQFAFSLRRYVFKNLSYDERATPAHRTKLKLQKLVDQAGICAYANCPTPHLKMTKDQEPELDRLDAIEGYTPENTVLTPWSISFRPAFDLLAGLALGSGQTSRLGTKIVSDISR